MKLLRPSKRVDSMLRITTLYSTFDIFEEEAAALAVERTAGRRRDDVDGRGVVGSQNPRSGVQEEMHVPNIDRKMMGEEDPRGMGMFLIQALVDEVEYVSELAEATRGW